ncbi:MAG: hypothetical protein SF097_27955 [Acidobacteriota bacterium]|nr:hypothetical protein [Acidobacteriota bacterium]
MSLQEIVSEIGRLPFLEKRQLIEILNKSLDRQPVLPEPTRPAEPISEDEVERILRAKGIISFADPSNYTDEDEDFEPIEVEGEPLSEQIIRERR